jgi:AraC-like DNA-binding protein
MKNIQSVDIATIRRFPTINFIGNDFALFANIGDISLFDHPTRLNASCLTLCLDGRCRTRINLREFELSEGSLVVTMPEQILQQVSRTDDFTALFIVVSAEFLDAVVPTVQQLLPLFLRVKEEPCIRLSSEEAQTIKEYYYFLQSKVKQPEYHFRKEIARGLLISLFFEVYNIYQREQPVVKAKSRKEELFDRFFRLISEQYKEHRSVSHYADAIHVNAKHLSTVIKEVSGRTAGEWIDNMVTLEAKALLKSSELSIQEIAKELNFPNQSFFGKYFKMHTGMTPRGYRNSE